MLLWVTFMFSEQIMCQKMAQGQLRTDGVINLSIVEAFLSINREQFVPDKYKNVAYMDGPIPISEEQELLPPKTIGKILQALDIKKDDHVLQIGSGTGYMSALLATLAKHVNIVELDSSLAQETGKNLEKTKIKNFKIINSDASFGWKSQTKYDIVIVTASMPDLIENFLDNLCLNGKLLVILGKAPAMQVTLIEKIAQNKYRRSILFETVVPKLVGVTTPDKFEF
jgi:protein-L-isoaspartate(D-aspartate) O-methyltransferase